jgi:N-acetylglutamate synthase-like GNAT family acetyltransferase
MALMIREAGAGDAKAIARLSAQLGYPANAGAILERIEQFAKMEQHAVFVAERDSQILAWLHVSRRESLEVSDYAEIAGLVVDEQARAQGIGSMLVEKAEQWAHQKGLARIRVRSNVVREQAHTFYRGLGFKESKTQAVFDKAVRGQG